MCVPTHCSFGQTTGSVTSTGLGIAMDISSGGSIVMTGVYTASGTAATAFEVQTLPAINLPGTSGSNDVFIIKLTSAGAVSWARR